MRRILMVMIAGLLSTACSGGIGSYEEGIDAQSDIMTEMVGVLAGVTDQESADAAAARIEALGNRLAEVAAQIKELPKPTMEELQEIGKKQVSEQREFQNKASAQMMKLAQYKSLRNAWSRAMSNMR